MSHFCEKICRNLCQNLCWIFHLNLESVILFLKIIFVFHTKNTFTEITNFSLNKINVSERNDFQISRHLNNRFNPTNQEQFIFIWNNFKISFYTDKKRSFAPNHSLNIKCPYVITKCRLILIDNLTTHHP